MGNNNKGEQTVFSLDAATLEERGQFKQLSFYPDKNAIGLEDMVLVEDDAPGIGKPQGATDEVWFERLHQGIVVRKDLVLDAAAAKAAFLLFCGREATGNKAPLHLSVNGYDLVRPPTKVAHPEARHYYTTDWGGAHFDNWFVIPVPTGVLQEGENVFLFWTEAEETAWEIMVAADSEYERGSVDRTAPGRSARSLDGGRTWDTEHLGHQGSISGEYCIRLSLDRYAATGVYRSAVIDITGSDSPLKERLDISGCRAEWELDIPPDCRVDIRARLGNSPLPDADDWGPFVAVDDDAHYWEKPDGRYLHFEAELSTAVPLYTPLLKGLRLETQIRATATSTTHLASYCNGRVVRPSFPFVHEDFAKVQPLRQQFELDRVVEGAAGEFDAQVRLMHWAYTVPIGNMDPYAWNYLDLPQAERDVNGELVRLGPYQRRRREGHCLYCNLTLVAACLALGYPARWVNVSTKHTYGHEVAEVWSNEFDKWILLDATRDYYLFDPETGIPLSLVETSQRLGAALPAPATWDFPVQHWLPDGIQPSQMNVACPKGDNPYPVFDPQVGSEDLVLIGHLQMPRRNDFASKPHPIPWRLSSNWGSDQFYCWYGDALPRKREYAAHTRRWQDFSPSLNQSELFLSQTDKEGELHVEVDSETPGFAAFLVQVDGGDWREEKEATWDWLLHTGLNHLRVKVQNSAGVFGPESWAEVVWHG
jgi:hypothetical protein